MESWQMKQTPPQGLGGYVVRIIPHGHKPWMAISHLFGHLEGVPQSYLGDNNSPWVINHKQVLRWCSKHNWVVMKTRWFWIPTWRIIPFSKWLITMVDKSPNWVYSLSKWPFSWPVNGGDHKYLLTGMVLQLLSIFVNLYLGDNN